MDDETRLRSFAAFERAVEIAGGQSPFERLTGARQQNVSNWLRKKRPLPGEFVLKAEFATGVSRHDLRPDLYPREPAEGLTPPPAALTRVGEGAPVVACDRSATLQVEPAR